jgi:hypothetical protein
VRISARSETFKKAAGARHRSSRFGLTTAFKGDLVEDKAFVFRIFNACD